MTVLTRDPPVAARPPRPRLRAAALVALLLAAAAGWWLLPSRHARPSEDRHSDQEPIPVVVDTARTRDVPVYLDGLGTVQASQTVTVKTQVDGQLVAVLFREGQDVHAGDVLARIDPRTYQAALDQAVAKKQQDQAMLANARLDLARYQRLMASSSTSAQTADTQRATVAQDVAQVAQDQAQIDTARTNLSFTTITAPIDGRTGLRQVDQGNVVHASDTAGLVVLTTLQPIAVVFSLPQQQLAQVTSAMATGAPDVQALPQAGAPAAAEIERGTLAVLDNQVDSSTGTMKLKALFPNRHLSLWPGAFVTARLHVSTVHGATVVPEAAIQRGPDGPFVYLIRAGKAERRPVVVTHEDASGAIVAQGVRPGERLVTDGAARLSNGAQVSIVQPPRAEKPGAA